MGKIALKSPLIFENDFFLWVAAFFTHSVTLPDGTLVEFENWDTAGQERYRSLTPMYYRGAAAAIIMYDITNSDSFDIAKYWVNQLETMGEDNTVIALVGNKDDLVDKRQVRTSMVDDYAKQHNMLFYETSAKTADHVNEVFLAIADRLPRTQPQSNRESIVVGSGASKKNGGGKKCC